MISELQAVRENIFPLAQAAIGDWQTFPWHRDPRGNIQAHKRHSSQALAIDVFGTISTSQSRDDVLDAVAARIGLPDGGPWTLELEWVDPTSSLGEPTPTQIDAIAFGASSTIIFECKLTESGGGCSQPKPLTRGAHRGLRQCNGSYEEQINPTSGINARCSLSAKGVRYWDFIPAVFGLSATDDHKPCPFAGDSFQWMRNVLLADRLAARTNRPVKVVAAFAEARGLVTADKVRSGGLGFPVAREELTIVPLAYQEIVRIAAGSSPDSYWLELTRWVQAKIDAAARR